MNKRCPHAALDLFRTAAASLVVAIHTSPLTSYTQAGDFFLTRILGRVAVPFFFMVSGYFLAQKGWASTRSFLKKTLVLYGGAVLLYLPLNWYQGGCSLWEWFRRLLVGGTLYHLWYFPALVLGVLLAKGLLRLKLPLALFAAALLYLKGLLIENSLLHFGTVLTLSCLLLALILLPRRPRKDARAWRELDLDALANNARALRSALAPGCRLMAVVKADAYGHGAVPVARALQRQGVHDFAVACLTEGIALRRAGIRGTILILGYTDPKEAPLLFRYRLTQTVADLPHALALSARKLPLHVHVAVDTGLHRLGVAAGDRETLPRLYQLKHLHVDGTFSHLSDCDSLCEEDMDRTRSQLEQFQKTLDTLRSRGCRPGKVHIQSSYAVWNLPPQRCDYARIGIALYGVYSSRSAVYRPLTLRPVLSLRSRVASVRTLGAGEWAGYGRGFQTRRETRLATVTIGYADGLPRDLPQRGGTVLIRGQRCPMVGRMFMDQLLVDVTDCAGAAAGDIVTLIGRDGGHYISAEQVADSCGTITNELLSRLGSRLTLIVR